MNNSELKTQNSELLKEMEMDSNQTDVMHEMVLDGNAAAGMLSEIFSVEMTSTPTECANCGREGEIGGLMAFTQSPGIVLRCPGCQQVMIRVSRTPSAIYLDARGAVYLRFPS